MYRNQNLAEFVLDPYRRTKPLNINTTVVRDKLGIICCVRNSLIYQYLRIGQNKRSKAKQR